MRRLVRRRAIGTWLVCLFLGTLSALAQEQKERIPSVDEIVQKMVATYKSLDTYQDSGHMTVEMRMGEQPMKQTFPVTIVYATGPRFKLVSPMAQLYCHDEKVTVYLPVLRQYMVQEYGADFWEQGIGPSELTSGEALRPDKFFGSEDPAAEYRKVVSGSKVTGGESVSGYDCWVIEGQFKMPGEEPVELAVPVKIWHRKEDGLLAQVRADMSEVFNAQMAEMGQAVRPAFEGFVLAYNVGTINLNKELPEGAFKFEPPAGSKKVEAFGPPEMPEGAEQVELSGKPAPDFELSTLEGGAIKLSDLKGKVVVLDFWATWCGPCRSELPELQKLWEKVKEKDVIVLGVNLDRRPEDAEGLVNELKLTFPVLLGSDSGVSVLYGLSGIPCIVLIDTEGIVQGRHVGYSPGIGERLEDEIEALLGNREAAPAEKRLEGGGSDS